MREITGISSGDIMYSDVKDITELDLSNPYDKDARILRMVYLIQTSSTIIKMIRIL